MILRCVLSIWGCIRWSVCPSVRRSVGPSVRPSVHPSVGNSSFQMPKMSGVLCENHGHSPTLKLLNVIHALGVLTVLNVLNVLNKPTDTSLACWALLLKTWCWLSVKVIPHRWKKNQEIYDYLPTSGVKCIIQAIFLTMSYHLMCNQWPDWSRLNHLNKNKCQETD